MLKPKKELTPEQWAEESRKRKGGCDAQKNKLAAAARAQERAVALEMDATIQARANADALATTAAAHVVLLLKGEALTHVLSGAMASSGTSNKHFEVVAIPGQTRFSGSGDTSSEVGESFRLCQRSCPST